MNQIEALVVVMGLGFFASVIISFWPKKILFFTKEKSKENFSIAIFILFFNLWPIFSTERLINRSGEPITNSLILLVSFLVFLLFLFLAFKAECKNKERKIKNTNGVSWFITVFAWFLVVTNLVSLMSTGKAYIGASPEVVEIMEGQSTMPLAWQYMYITASAVINILCAVLIFKANSIGRIMFVGWTSISFLVAFTTYSDATSLIWSLIFYVIFAAILFSPKGDEYFSSVKQ